MTFSIRHWRQGSVSTFSIKCIILKVSYLLKLNTYNKKNQLVSTPLNFNWHTYMVCMLSTHAFDKYVKKKDYYHYSSTILYGDVSVMWVRIKIPISNNIFRPKNY